MASSSASGSPAAAQAQKKSPNGQSAVVNAPPTVQKLNFPGIRKNSGSDAGPFRIGTDVFGWKNLRTNAVDMYNASQVVSMFWQRENAREFSISFMVKTSEEEDEHENDPDAATTKVVEFCGFREGDIQASAKFIKQHWGLDLPQNKISTKGWHWGEYRTSENRFKFDVDGRTGFVIDYDLVSNVASAKNELSVELHKNARTADAATGLNDDKLIEIRFCVPPPKEGDATTTTEKIKSEILSASGLSVSLTDAVCSFAYKQCLMPPGRFDVNLCLDAFRLSGKSSEFNVPYNNIIGVFVLPAAASSGMNVILQLDTPLRKGGTRYAAVIVQLDERKEISVNPNCPSAELESMKRRSPDVEENMTGVEHELFVQLLKGLLSPAIKIVQTSKYGYKGASSLPCFRCSHKVSSGFFYPLDKEFVFMPKPIIIVRYDEVASIDFNRTSSAQTKLFEFSLNLKNGTEFEFSSIDRSELQPFLELLTEKKIRVKSAVGQDLENNSAPGEKQSMAARADVDDESEDADYDEGDEEVEGSSSSSSGSEGSSSDDEEASGSEKKDKDGGAASSSKHKSSSSHKRKRSGDKHTTGGSKKAKQ